MQHSIEDLYHDVAMVIHVGLNLALRLWAADCQWAAGQLFRLCQIAGSCLKTREKLDLFPVVVLVAAAHCDLQDGMRA